LPNFPHCIGQDCITLDYRIIANPIDTSVPAYVTYVINYIAEKRGFRIGPNRDLVEGAPITSYVELQDYYTSYRKTPNKTQIGVIFCGSVPDNA